MAILEVAVETLDEAQAAEAGGAARVELCANLAEQGTTPAEALIAAATEHLGIPVFVMIRPRAGSFVYAPAEVAAMRAQARRARALGAHGVVTGALADRTGAIDHAAMTELVEAAAPLPVTFHRAFDVAPDRGAALETLVALGVSRVLTSGGAATAAEGATELSRLVLLAGDRLTVVAAGGIRAHNVRSLIVSTAVTEVHARLGTEAEVAAVARQLGPDQHRAW